MSKDTVGYKTIKGCKEMLTIKVRTVVTFGGRGSVFWERAHG